MIIKGEFTSSTFKVLDLSQRITEFLGNQGPFLIQAGNGDDIRISSLDFRQIFVNCAEKSVSLSAKVSVSTTSMPASAKTF